VLGWRSPVPAEVRRLAGVRPDGAEVRVVPRPYSTRELQHAVQRLTRYLDAHGIRWSTVSGCRSERGVELQVPGAATELPVSQAELDAAAGVRVRVTGGVTVQAVRG
jgi:hypothetical protein